eukprot:g2191.t1
MQPYALLNKPPVERIWAELLGKYQLKAIVRPRKLENEAKDIAKRAREYVPTTADTIENLDEKKVKKFIRDSRAALEGSSVEAVAAKLVADAQSDIENDGALSPAEKGDLKTRAGKQLPAIVGVAQLGEKLPAAVAQLVTSVSQETQKAREALAWLEELVAGERDRREISSQAKDLADRVVAKCAQKREALDAANQQLDEKHLEQIDNSIQTIRAETSSGFEALVDRATANQENAQRQLQLVLASNEQSDSEATKFREAITRNLNTARRSLDKTMEQEQSRAERLLTDIEDLIGAKRRELADMQKEADEKEKISDTGSEAPTEVPGEGDDLPDSDLVEDDQEQVEGEGINDANAANNPSSPSGVGPDQEEGREAEQMTGSGVSRPHLKDHTRTEPYGAGAIIPYKSPKEQSDELRRQVQQAAARRIYGFATSFHCSCAWGWDSHT